jgi:hypothetical protein
MTSVGQFSSLEQPLREFLMPNGFTREFLDEYWGWIIAIAFIFLAIWALPGLVGRAPRRNYQFGNPPDSLRRRPFNDNTIRDAENRMVRQQFARFGQPDPNSAQLNAARAEIARGLRGQREFAVRHVEADSVIRHFIHRMLRMPTPELVGAVRALATAISGALGNRIDDVGDEVLRDDWNGQRWHATLGRNRVRQLSDAIAQCVGNVFFGEAQGNLRAGTRPDITFEAMAQLGGERVTEIAESLINLLRVAGLHPRIAFINRQPMIDFDGATGEYVQYGYDENADMDEVVHPLRVVGPTSAIVLLHNTDGTNLVALARHAIVNMPTRIRLLLLLMAAATILYMRLSEA